MRTVAEVLWVASTALRARPLRAALMGVGPLLGVAVIVAAIGVMQSASGELRSALEELGRDVVLLTAPGDKLLPAESPARVEAVSTVEAVAGLAPVVGVTASASSMDNGSPSPVGFATFKADPSLPQVVKVPLAWGRSLAPFDDANSTNAVVIGSAVASRLVLDTKALTSIFLNGQEFGVVGVLEPSLLAPELDEALLISHTTAKDLFGSESGYSQLYVRVDEGAMTATTSILPTAVDLGERGVAPGVSVPADLISAQVAIDRSLAGAVIALGALAMLIGGLGITNVMLISVLERQREIGVRRALGHSRWTIAAQFLTEAMIVGSLGALLGGGAALAFVRAVAVSRGWVAVFNPGLWIAVIAAAILLTALAAIYPASRATRLQPLEALRAE